MTQQPKRRAALGLPLHPSEARVAHRPFTVAVEDQHVAIGAGDWLHKDDPLVEEFPESFETVEAFHKRGEEARKARLGYEAEVNKDQWE